MIGRATVGRCPRCGYQGEGLSYFSRGANVAKLVGLTMVTAGAMGVGGIVFYVVRRDHQVCPRCGKRWGRYGERAVLPATRAGSPAAPGERALARRSREGAMRSWSIALFVFAAILVIAGVAAGELGAAMAGLIAGGGGLFVHHAAGRERERRRAELISSLQLPVLKLAARRGGRLTVTETAAELGWTLPRAEKVLQSLDDGIRVDSEVTDEGVIVYQFLELRQASGPGLPPPEPRA